MNERTEQLQRLLAALADPSRFQILCELAAGPRHVSDLAVSLGLSQSCTTRHIQALSRVGSVTCQRAGKRVMVSVQLEDERTRALLGWIAAAEGNEAIPRFATSSPTKAFVGERKPRGQRKNSPVPPPRKEHPHSDPTASGTSETLSNLPRPSIVVRRPALEDFLL